MDVEAILIFSPPLRCRMTFSEAEIIREEIGLSIRPSAQRLFFHEFRLVLGVALEFN